MSSIAKKEKRLQKAGYTTRKGQFGAVRIMKGGAKKQVQIYEDENYLIINNPREYGKPNRTIKIENGSNVKITLDSNGFRQKTFTTNSFIHHMDTPMDITKENSFITHNNSKIPLYEFINKVFPSWSKGGEKVITKKDIHKYFPRYYYKIADIGEGRVAYKDWLYKYISSFVRLVHNVSRKPVIYSIELNGGKIIYIKRLNDVNAWAGGQDTLQVLDTENKLIKKNEKNNKTIDLVVELKSDYVPDFNEIIGVVKLKHILKNSTNSTNSTNLTNSTNDNNDNNESSNGNDKSSLDAHKRNLKQAINKTNNGYSDPFNYIRNKNLG